MVALEFGILVGGVVVEAFGFGDGPSVKVRIGVDDTSAFQMMRLPVYFQSQVMT